jgi:hypothetical protein
MFLLASILFSVFILAVLPGQSDKAEETYEDVRTPDLSFFYTTEDLYQMAEALGEEGRQSYVRSRFTFDLVWPLVYAFFLVTGISWVTRKAFAPGSSWLRANVAPLPALLLDYLENVSTSVVMVRYPAQTAVLDHIATVFTMAKWVFVNLSFILLLMGFVWFIFSKLRKK